MAIVKMSKFNLIAFESQKSKLLKNLQKFREVSFIDIDLEENMNTDEEKIVKKVVNNEDLTRIDERLNGVENAISLVRKYHVFKKGWQEMTTILLKNCLKKLKRMTGRKPILI